MSDCAKTERAEIRIAGKTCYVPSADVHGRTIVVTGNWLRRAVIKDEELVQGELIDDPAEFVAGMKKTHLRADILTFAQKIPDIEPKYRYDFHWDNWAATPTSSFNEWWEKRLPQESRKNVRRSAKRGVVVNAIQFDDELVKGIQEIYNETPVRQGRPFWHFGKDFDTVKKENATYLDRSEFIGAYFNEELIGFIKLIYVDRLAMIIQILSKNEHQDKRPLNALLAKSVQVCESKGISSLIYGKYTYDGNPNSSLAEFKRRNGFEEIKYPRYILPLSARGKVAIRLGLDKGVKGVLPVSAVSFLRNLRTQFYERRYSARENVQNTVNSVQ
jgi:hypothetical protein